MESLAVLASAMLGAVLGQLAPGPNLLAVATAGLRSGRRTALAVSLGVATGIFCWVTVAVAGLGAVLLLNPELSAILSICGGLYLLYLALRAFLRAGSADPIDLTDDEAARRGGFLRGFLVAITNPKSALIWASIATFLLNAGLSTSTALAFAPLAALSGLAVYCVYSCVFSTAPARRLYARLARWVEAMLGATFGAIGGVLLLDGFRSLSR
ncbi:MAG: LysE family transporter [Pseudomonadota bacterium]